MGVNGLKFSFMNRIVGEWNCLSPDIRQASSVVDFKSKVFKFLFILEFLYLYY